MKKIILFTLFIGLTYWSHAQIRLYNASGVEISGDTLIFDHAIDTTAFNFDIEHKNIVVPVNESTDTMDIDVIREEITTIPGTGDYYCWGTQCFGEIAAGSRPSWKANDPVITPPDSTAGGIGFAVYLSNKNKLGKALYKYTFVNDRDSREQAFLYVRYNLHDESLSVKNDDGDKLTTNPSIFWNAIDTTNPVSYYAYRDFANIKNNTSFPIKIALSIQEQSVMSNISDSIIWNGVSYPKTNSGQTNRSFNDTLILNPDQSVNDAIQIFYFPNNLVAESSYRYTLNMISQDLGTKQVSFDIRFSTSYLTGLSDASFNKNYRLYPNPASDLFVASFETKFSNANHMINIYNLVGEKVFESNISSGANQIEVATSDLKAGVYFVNILSDGKLLGSKKLIIR